MSFIEKALQRLKQQEETMAPLGRLDPPADPVEDPPMAPGIATAAPVDNAPGFQTSPDPRPHRGKVVSIDRQRLREEGFLAPDDQQRRMADEYRRIKRPIIAHAFGIGATQVEK